MRKERISNYRETLQDLRQLNRELSFDTKEKDRLAAIIDKLEPKKPQIKLLGNHAPQQVCPVCGRPVYYRTFHDEFHDNMCFCGTVIDWGNYSGKI